MFRARGSMVSSVPIPGVGDCHTIHLLFFMISVIMCGVLGGVFMSMGYAVVIPSYRPLRLESHMVEWWWTVGPMVIVLLVALPTLVTMFYGGPSSARPLVTVMAIGHQWYWEYQHNHQGGVWGVDSYTNVNPSIYGESRLASSDSHLVWPWGVPVRLMVTSADVVHNFNLKSLALSLDAVPGRCHTTMVQAQAPGIYTGLCSEVCGPGHYSMALVVEAVGVSAYTGMFRDL